MDLDGIKDLAVDIHGIQPKGLTGHVHVDDTVVMQTGSHLPNGGAVSSGTFV